MSMPQNRASYTDCYAIFDRAKESANGIRVGPNTQSIAEHLRHRLHYSRAVDRRESSKIYPKGDPKYNASPYDELVCRLAEDTEGGWWVYVEPRRIKGEIEELEADHGA